MTPLENSWVTNSPWIGSPSTTISSPVGRSIVAMMSSRFKVAIPPWNLASLAGALDAAGSHVAHVHQCSILPEPRLRQWKSAGRVVEDEVLTIVSTDGY